MSATPLQQLTVAIAGGDAPTRDWLLTTLRDAGHVAEHSANGGDALSWLESNAADLLVVCIGLVEPSAAELVEEALQRQPGMGVLYVADPHAEAVPWTAVPPGGVLLYGPSGPDLLPAVAVALTRARR